MIDPFELDTFYRAYLRQYTRNPIGSGTPHGFSSGDFKAYCEVLRNSGLIESSHRYSGPIYRGYATVNGEERPITPPGALFEKPAKEQA